MSYSEFPPPLSSSPPPLDALPPMLDEDEDELGIGGPHSPAFDITGLSEKLPPTPMDSPIKVSPLTDSYPPLLHLAPAELHSSGTTLSTPDQCPNSFPRKGEVPKFSKSCKSTNDDFEDFSNFQNNQELNMSNVEPFDDFSGVESARSCNSYFEDEHTNTGFVQMPDDLQVPTQAVDNKTSSSHNVNNHNLETPPILNNDSSTSKDLIIDEHRQIVNDEHYDSKSDDESNHRFHKKSELTDPFNDDINSFDKSTVTERKKIQNPMEDSEDYSKYLVSNQNNFIVDCVSTSDKELPCPLKMDYLEASTNSEFGEFAAIGSELNEASFDQSGHTSTILNQPVTSISEETTLFKSPFDAALKQEPLQSTELFTDFGAFANFESISVSESPSSALTFEASFEPILGASLQSATDASLNTFPDENPGDGFIAEVGVIADDVVKSCSLPTIEGATDVSPDADDDFGYRDIDGEEEVESDCETRQTHLRQDKREEVVVIEAKNKLVKCAEDQRSAESNSDHWNHTRIEDDKGDLDDDDDDEFDDFVVNTDSPVHEMDIIEFDEFASAKIDDAFGEFASNTRDGTKSKGGSNFDEDDDFGEFGTFNSGTSEVAADGRKCSVTGLARGTSVDAGPGNGDPLLSRLESLVLKWTARPDCINQADLQQQPPQLLRDVVCGDAFVWRKLECVEWQSVVWSSSLAHQLMLTALNIDARNILYNQKWSSSVPLFAQSLTFSPLTPAKPSSINSGISAGQNSSSPSSQRQHQGLTPTVVPHSVPWNPCGGENDSVNSSLQLSADEPTSKADFDAAHPHVGLAASGCSGDTITSESLDAFAAASLTGSSAEPRVPPPQFDWLASGLSNPLDQPASSGDLATDKGMPRMDVAGAHPPLPSAVQQLLARCSATSSSTPLDQLSEQERRFLQGLPDISFMAAKVLMFPIVGTTD